jgi:hypothetical protein
LCEPSFYFLYIGNYNSLCRIWSFTIGLWYLIFTTCMSEVPIVIGFEHTKVLLVYLLDNQQIGFRGLCFHTVYLLDDLSKILGSVIHLPSYLSVFRLLSSFLKNDKTGCSGREEPTNEKSSSWFSFFSPPKPPKRSTRAEDLAHCTSLEKMLRQNRNFFNPFHAEASQVDRGRITRYTEDWWFGVGGGTRSTCFSRDMTKAETAASKKPGRYWGLGWWYS